MPGPTIASVFPASGPLSGGTQITIMGSGFTGASGVAFGAITAGSFLPLSDAQVLVVTPPGAVAGTVPVTVITSAGSTGTTPGSQFTYLTAGTPGGAGGGAGAGAGASSAGSGSGPTGAGAGGSTSGGAGGGAAGSGGAASAPGSGAAGAGAPSAGSTAPGSSGGGTTPGGTPSGSGSPATPGGAPTPGGAGGTGSPAPGSTSPGAGSSGAPTPSGNYIPGGAQIVPGGQTGPGGTAGTGAGFGVGTLLPGGGGSAAPSNLPYYVDPGLTPQLMQSLVGILQNAASPDAIESQNIILRRLALEGDVIGSRVPPPRNISEIGGYMNLLATMKETSMREQALAGILGVAGPSQPLGWISNVQPLAMVAIQNDRPPVAAQPSFPLSVLVRSDFVAGVQLALKALHGYGATLPMVSAPVLALPPGGTGSVPPTDVLLYLGRTLTIAPSAALVNAEADPVALVRPTGTSGDFVLATRVLNLTTIPVAQSSLDAVQCTPATQAVVTLAPAPFVSLAPILATAGFYSANPVPVPPNSTVRAWARLTNTTGLIVGATQLGDELTMLYRPDQIASSVFAAMLMWKWNGTTFVA